MKVYLIVTEEWGIEGYTGEYVILTAPFSTLEQALAYADTTLTHSLIPVHWDILPVEIDDPDGFDSAVAALEHKKMEAAKRPKANKETE